MILAAPSLPSKLFFTVKSGNWIRESSLGSHFSHAVSALAQRLRRTRYDR